LRAVAGLEFVTRCTEGRDLAARVVDFQRTIREFGFTASACAAWVSAGRHRSTRFFFRDWPPDWLERYAAEGWLDHDFVVVEARRRMAPFRWEDILSERRLSCREAKVHGAALQYGWADLFAVPIHGPAGYCGLVTMAAKSHCALSPADRAALQMMAGAIHEQCRSAVGFGNLDASAVRLTKREIECLQWVGGGKTDWEIAQLLGVTAATVHFHIEHAKKKLDTRTRAQAVALAVLHGIF